MALLEWNAGLSVDVSEMDTEHKQLIGLVNELNDAMREGRSRQEMSRVLDGLIRYTQNHFASEEHYMRQVGYPYLAEHVAEHAALLKQVADFKSDFESGKALVSVKLMGFLRDWVRNHIQRSDKKYGVWARAKVGA